MDVAQEKTHYGEFHEMLVRVDDEQVRKLEKRALSFVRTLEMAEWLSAIMKILCKKQGEGEKDLLGF